MDFLLPYKRLNMLAIMLANFKEKLVTIGLKEDAIESTTKLAEDLSFVGFGIEQYNEGVNVKITLYRLIESDIELIF